MRATFIDCAANFALIYNFAYQKGIFYLNQFALVIEFLQTFSIKYSFLLFKVLVNTIFTEYPKEFALTNQPSPVGEGAAKRRMRRLIRYRFSLSENLPKHTQ